MTRRLSVAFLGALLATGASAQRTPAQIDSTFALLPLPTPSPYRSADGRPGPAYWQNRADYQIQARLDEATHTVTGTVRIRYTNRSPEALPYVWVQLEQNLFRPDSRGARRTPPDSRWRGSFPGGGYRLGNVTVGGQAVTPVVSDTRMRLDLPRPLGSGDALDIAVPYAFVVPEYGADRMGRLETAQGTVYEIAQWFPRMAVYDDVSGWNTLPYLGQGEFYLDYGDIDYEITAPADMTIVGTGALQNEREVYSEEQRARLAEARRSADRVYIVRPDEVGASAQGTKTWRFRAENVRDAAWAASRAFILDAATASVIQDNERPNDVLIMSAYPAEGIGTPEAPGWEEATRFGRASILNNSRWYPYPYPVAISVAGVVGGMEYPMFQFSGVEARGQSLFGVVDHELGHNWFPMIVGSDERRYAWMDEGFNTFLNTFSNTAFYDTEAPRGFAGRGLGDSTRVRRLTTGHAAAGFLREPYSQDQTIMTPPDRIRPAALGWLAYRKPGKGLLLLRNQILGPERFDAAFKSYIRRWAYKHPQPADFMRTMEDVSGEDLSWFWREWLYGTDRYDAEMAGVSVIDGQAVAAVRNRLALVFPATVEFVFADGSVQRATIPVETWATTDEATARVPLGDRTLRAARLDPDGLLPDDDRSNDAATM